MTEELQPNQKWMLSDELTIGTLERILNTLRSTGKVYIEAAEGTLIPSLTGLLMKAQAEAVAFINMKEMTVRRMVPGEPIS